MIGIIFNFGTEVIEVRIIRSNVFFRNSQLTNFVDISGIKLNKVGVLKEFPDLKDKKNWEEVARTRFKDKIKEYKTERKRANYVIEDLKKFGYKPMYEQVSGFRAKKLN